MLRYSNRTIKALLFLSAPLLSTSAQPQTITGKVVGVSDGDTIAVLDEQKRQHKIRLEGMWICL
jgi:endonuclease YncB( thermonuclease family)